MPLPSQKAFPSALVGFTLWFRAWLYLEAVLLGHELLGLALVGGLQERAGRLGGEETSGGPIAVL